jgi:NAD(P)-dependent dehydrogenase (short-subunit alcohol dehydrogenase family)
MPQLRVLGSSASRRRNTLDAWASASGTDTVSCLGGKGHYRSVDGRGGIRLSKRALVTGASRGIGKATAIALAIAGYDVAIAARTRHEPSKGDVLESSQSVGGSLETTCRLVEEIGRQALPLTMDLLDLKSLHAAVDELEVQWGGVDVLVNNAIHRGEGDTALFSDASPEMLRTKFEANVVAPVVLCQRLLPNMAKQSSGLVINVTSGAAVTDPRARVGEGGPAFAYSISKSAFHRVAGYIALEYGENGIRAFNLDPGYVLTEWMRHVSASRGLTEMKGAPPSVPASVIAWLATDPVDGPANGDTVAALRVAKEHGMHPPWDS